MRLRRQMELFRVGFLRVGLTDLVDIAVVAFIFYYLLLLMKGTRAAQMLLGAIFFLAAWFAAAWLQFDALRWMISRVLTVGVIAFVILFQPELRSALARLGQNPFFRRLFVTGGTESLDEVVKASVRLSEKGLGGLMVMERDVGLKDLLETGRTVGAKVSADLLVTIFTPPGPLHDGAVLIRGGEILAAGCVLPLSQSIKYDRLFGMRHRAAVGITEQSDAVVVVVSEETGAISLVVGGRLKRDLDGPTLKADLVSLFARR